MSVLGSLTAFFGNLEQTKKGSRFKNKSHDFDLDDGSTSANKQNLTVLTDIFKKGYKLDLRTPRVEGLQTSDRKYLRVQCKDSPTTRKKGFGKQANNFKEITSRISSHRDPNELEPPLQSSVKMQEKIRNELMMKNNHYIMRSMRKNLRENEKASNSSFSESNTLFHRLVQKVMDDTAKPEPMRFKKMIDTEKVVQKHSEAAEKTVRASYTAWMKKRGSFDEYQDTNKAKIIFQMLDTEDKGEINGEVLVKFLVEIGVSLHPQKIKQAVMLALRKDSNHFKIKQDDILALCKGDYKTNLILRYLNEDVKAEKLNKLELMNFNISDIVLADQIEILSNWWQLIDKDTYNQVPVNSVADFLISKSIVNDSYEGRKLIKEINEDTNYIEKDQFLALFIKPLVKWALITVNKKFSVEEWKNPDYSPAHKINHLKRDLILAGLKCPRPGVSQEEGVAVISAIERYRKYEKKPVNKMNFDEFAEYWKETVVQRNRKAESSLEVSIPTVESPTGRPSSVPSIKLCTENAFYQEFAKFVKFKT